MKLTRHEIQKLEDYWINLHEYKKKLKFREWELLYAYKEQDTNMGGGKANTISDTTFQKAAALVEDELYNKLKKVIETIENIYSTLTEDEKVIIDMRYKQTFSCYEWEDIAEELGFSRRKVLRMRDNIIDRTALAINWV